MPMTIKTLCVTIISCISGFGNALTFLTWHNDKEVAFILKSVYNYKGWWFVIKITAEELKKDFGKYFHMVQNGEKIIIVSEKSIPILLSSCGSISDSVTGVLSNDYDDKELIKEKYNKE